MHLNVETGYKLVRFASPPAKTGDVVISDIAEPHGLRAKTDLRLLVTIAPPI